MDKELKLCLELLNGQKVSRQYAHIETSQNTLKISSLCAEFPLERQIKSCKKAGFSTLQKQLEKECLFYSLKNKLFLEQFSKVCLSFSKKGIIFFPLKSFAYPDIISARRISDIDIFVSKKFLKAAVRELKRIGFERSAVKSAYYFRQFSEQALFFLKKFPEIKVELHWALKPRSSPFSINEDAVLDDLIMRSFKGTKFKLMRPEENIIYYSINSLYSPSPVTFLKGICSISEIIKINKVNWERLIQISYEWKANNFVSITLELCNKYFNSKIPLQVIRNTRKAGFQRVVLLIISKKTIRKESALSLFDLLSELALSSASGKLLILQRSFYTLRNLA
jgi:hypothetical protein